MKEDIVDVLVVGAGPTGLAMAAEALRHNLTCRIVERKTHRSMNQSKALVIHARTMEQLHAMGDSQNCRGRVTNRLCEVGTKFRSLRAYIEGTDGRAHERVHEFREEDEFWGDTDFPFWLVVPQCRTEKILEGELELMGGQVEWSSEITSIEHCTGFHTAHIVKNGSCNNDQDDDKVDTIMCRWIVGCDGKRSITREHANLILEEETNDGPDDCFLADVELGTAKAKQFFQSDVGHIILHPDGAMAILPVGENNLFRVMAHDTSTAKSAIKLTEIDKKFIDDCVRRRTGVDIDSQRIAWASTWKNTHGITNQYHNGEGIFVAGDAAHVHSPLGGQGMNFGLQDATNLAWKLAWIKRMIDKAKIELNEPSIGAIIESYNAERRGAAVTMINGNTSGTMVVTSSNAMIFWIRNAIFKNVFGGKWFRKIVSNTVPMINLQYESSPIILKPWASLMAPSPGPGSRVPNFTVIAGENEQKLYDIIDRSSHSWLIILTGEDTNIGSMKKGPGGLPVHRISNENCSGMTHCILVRPDLFIGAVGDDPEHMWTQLVPFLGKAIVGMGP